MVGPAAKRHKEVAGGRAGFDAMPLETVPNKPFSLGEAKEDRLASLRDKKKYER